jgi:chloride channel 7
LKRCACAGLYALICATASLAGVFRSAISLVVLVVEGTRGINFLFAVIIAVVVANFMGAILQQDGVYESEIERDHAVLYLHHEPPRRLATLTAGDVRPAPLHVTIWLCLLAVDIHPIRSLKFEVLRSPEL